LGDTEPIYQTTINKVSSGQFHPGISPAQKFPAKIESGENRPLHS
jgi:hypothetical protein